jgi:uncharacterized protein YbaP (TraB family)
MREFPATTAGPSAAAGWVRVVALLLCLALPGLVAPPAARAAERFEHGLLWRVEGKGVAPSHVFGTIHLADPRVTRLPPAVEREFGAARSLTIEARLEPQGVAALASQMTYADGRGLPEVAGEALFSRAAAFLAARGMPEPVVRMFKPWAVAMLLSVPPQNPAEVLDFRLMQIAVSQGKPVHQLESMQEQAALFEGLSQDDQVALLRHAVDNHERMPQLIGRIVDAYLARDLAALSRISHEAGDGDPRAQRLREEIHRRLLRERNARMAERVQARLAEGGAFVAVGALHLYGPGGVPALLQARGWRVTRVY